MNTILGNQLNHWVQSCQGIFTFLILLGVVWAPLCPIEGQAAGFRSPDECLAYSDDAHLNCLYAYIEIQKNEIVKLEEALNTQKRTTDHLQDRVAQQTSLAQRLQEQNDTYHRGLHEYRYPRLRPYANFSYFWGRPHYYRRLFRPSFGLYFDPYYSAW